MPPRCCCIFDHTIPFFLVVILLFFAAALRPIITMFSNSTNNALAARHIQTDSDVEYTIDYWGYAVRNFPCTNDAGSCEYLDAVYSNHYTSMIFTFILWAVLGAVLLLTLLSRLIRPQRRNGAKQSLLYRLVRLGSATIRRYLMPECSKVFRYTTRLQALILALLCVYLTAFS
jgi:ferric-chelate reductase